MSHGKNYFFVKKITKIGKKPFSSRVVSIGRWTEIIMLCVVTTTRTCTGIFCRNYEHAGDNCRVHASGLLSPQEQGSLFFLAWVSKTSHKKKKSSVKETSGICCRKENSAGHGARCWLKLGGGYRDVSPIVYF